MAIKSIILAVAAGIAAFLLVGVAVTELAQPWIEFSLFLGIPAGIIAGVIIATAVYLGLADDAPARRRRIAGTFAGFGAGFLVALIGLGWVGNVGVTFAIALSVVIAVGVAAVAYLRGPREHGATGSGQLDGTNQQ